MLDNLYPILGKHSVNRSKITLYLPQEVIKPEKLFDKINHDEYFSKKYQRRSLRFSKVINFKSENNLISINEDVKKDNVIGFSFEEFNENGELENILVLQNENNKSVISFETRKYIRWKIFFDRFYEDLKLLIDNYEFYFEALSLTYIDEFIWKSDEIIPVKEIFETNSELINSKFLKSRNGTIVLFSQSEENNLEEKTEISFNNDLKRIQVIHQHATNFKDLLDSKLLKENILDILNIAHISNKETLNGLFTNEVKVKINLN